MNIKKTILLGMMGRAKRGFKKITRPAEGGLTLEQAIARVTPMREQTEFGGKLMQRVIGLADGVRQETLMLDGVKTFKATPEKPNDKAIIYIHGGAFFLGLMYIQKIFASYVAKATEATVFSIDYRLAPEHPFPAALDDCFAVYKDLLKQGFDPKKIIVMGDSAGGNMTLTLLLKLKLEKLPLPGAAIPLSPATDMNYSGESITTRADVDPVLGFDDPEILKYMLLRGHSSDDPLASPLKGDLKGLPPLMIMVGGLEILYSDSINFAEKAKAAGVDVTLDIEEDMFHVYPTFYGFLDEAKVALGKIALFIKMKTG